MIIFTCSFKIASLVLSSFWKIKMNWDWLQFYFSSNLYFKKLFGSLDLKHAFWKYSHSWSSINSVND